MFIEERPVESITPYSRNPRRNQAAVAKVRASINEFGWRQPIVVDADGVILVGHTRYQAALDLGMATVPVHIAEGLTAAQAKAYRIMDNRSHEAAEWDLDMLSLEVDDLRADGFDLDLTGFSEDDLSGMIEGFGDDPDEPTGIDDTYSRKIEAPIYEPKGECPPVCDLADDAKARELRAEIDAAAIPEEVRGFLRAAADRHTVFHFRRIAEFYAHADADVQHLMERSALVIIDFDKAIENGFVALTERLGQIADAEGWNGHDA